MFAALYPFMSIFIAFFFLDSEVKTLFLSSLFGKTLQASGKLNFLLTTCQQLSPAFSPVWTFHTNSDARFCPAGCRSRFPCRCRRISLQAVRGGTGGAQPPRAGQDSADVGNAQRTVPSIRHGSVISPQLPARMFLYSRPPVSAPGRGFWSAYCSREPCNRRTFLLIQINMICKTSSINNRLRPNGL